MTNRSHSTTSASTPRRTRRRHVAGRSRIAVAAGSTAALFGLTGALMHAGGVTVGSQATSDAAATTAAATSAVRSSEDSSQQSTWAASSSTAVRAVPVSRTSAS